MKGIEVEEINYAKKPLDADTITAIVRAAGGVAAVLNTRHEIAKTRGWNEDPPREADFVAAAAKEPNLLRRPILIRGNTVRSGSAGNIYAVSGRSRVDLFSKRRVELGFSRDLRDSRPGACTARPNES